MTNKIELQRMLDLPHDKEITLTVGEMNDLFEAGCEQGHVGTWIVNGWITDPLTGETIRPWSGLSHGADEYRERLESVGVTKVYEVKKSVLDTMGVCEYTVGMYAEREVAEDVASRKQAVADEWRDDYSCETYRVIEHEVKENLDD